MMSDRSRVSPKPYRFRTAAVTVSFAMVIAACGGSSDPQSTPGRSSTGDRSSGIGSPMHHGGGLVLDPASVMGRPDRIIAGPQGNDGQFLVECELSHLAADDPILYPGEPGASHLHAFFGNVTTSATSRMDDLLGQETSCDDFRDTAAYWVPVLMDGPTPIEPDYSVAYYRAGIDVDPDLVESYPPGLVMIAGDPLATSEQPLEVVSWSCGHGARKGAVPPVCPTGADVRLSVTFPDCWDGKNLDTPGHRRHVHYSSGGRCPSSHPVHIPQLVFAVHFPVNGDISHLRLSSGTLGSGHADFLNAWDQDHLDHEVDLCIRQQNVCAISSGRRPV
jgi:hypothetical protein